MKLLIMLSLVLNLAFAATPEEKGLEIAKKIDAFNDGFKGEESEMEMILINAHGDKIIRKMESKVLEKQDDGNRSLITFKWPADVKGTKMLTWTHKSENDDQWLYLPAFRRVKRISSRNKSGSFMGSEFSYEDLGSQEVEKYTYKYLKDVKVNGRVHWLMERFPIDKKSGYSKQKSWIDKEYMASTKVEYYDRKGELLKTATFSDFKKFKKFYRSDKIEMVNHQTKKSSILNFKNRELFKNFSSSIFNKNRLK
jgi:outer membrane lipoprotein-sorting protein